MRSFFTHAMSAVILCGCSATPVVQIPEAPDLPANWGMLATRLLGQSKCPDLQGTYLNLPKLVTFEKQGTTHSSGNDLDFYSLFPVYLTTRKVLPPEKADHDPIDSLTLQQPSPNELVLTIAAHDRLERIAYHFYYEEGHFECSKGFLEFPVSSTYGMGEETLLNGQNREKISLVNYADLVVIRSWGPFRSRKSNVSSEFTHQLYRYPRLSN